MARQPLPSEGLLCALSRGVVVSAFLQTGRRWLSKAFPFPTSVASLWKKGLSSSWVKRRAPLAEAKGGGGGGGRPTRGVPWCRPGNLGGGHLEGRLPRVCGQGTGGSRGAGRRGKRGRALACAGYKGGQLTPQGRSPVTTPSGRGGGGRLGPPPNPPFALHQAAGPEVAGWPQKGGAIKRRRGRAFI